MGTEGGGSGCNLYQDMYHSICISVHVQCKGSLQVNFVIRLTHMSICSGVSFCLRLLCCVCTVVSEGGRVVSLSQSKVYAWQGHWKIREGI